MNKTEKIIKLAWHYAREIFDDGCLDLENDLSEYEIQQAINMAKQFKEEDQNESV